MTHSWRVDWKLPVGPIVWFCSGDIGPYKPSHLGLMAYSVGAHTLFALVSCSSILNKPFSQPVNIRLHQNESSPELFSHRRGKVILKVESKQSNLVCRADKIAACGLRSTSTGIADIKLISSHLVMEREGEMPWPLELESCVNNGERAAPRAAGVCGDLWSLRGDRQSQCDSWSFPDSP